MIIRNFELSDLNEILRIEFELFNEPYPAGLLLDLYKNGAGFLVAEINNQVVGYILFWFKESDGHIIAIGIKRNYQRMNIGSALLEKAIRVFYISETKTIKLEVRKSNTKARHFYRKNGFEEIGEDECYYNDGESAIIMQYKIM